MEVVAPIAPLVSSHPSLAAALLSHASGDFVCDVAPALCDAAMAPPSCGHAVIVVPKNCTASEASRLSSSAPSVYIASETADFRKVAQVAVSSDDVVLEVGAAHVVATAILARSAARVLAVDVSEEALAMAQQRCCRLNNVVFHRCDAWLCNEQLEEFGGEASAVFLDTGGDRLHGDILWLVNRICRQLCPRLLCVKSRSLWRSASCLGHGGKLESLTKASRLPDDFRALFRSAGAPSAFDNHRLRSQHFVSKEIDMNLTSAEMTRRRHPLDYPSRLVPSTAGLDVAGKKICRFHNFFDEGCRRGENCGYDHEHCYWCSAPGHRALNCCQGMPAAIVGAIGDVVE